MRVSFAELLFLVFLGLFLFGKFPSLFQRLGTSLRGLHKALTSSEKDSSKKSSSKKD